MFLFLGDCLHQTINENNNDHLIRLDKSQYVIIMYTYSSRNFAQFGTSAHPFEN